MRAILVLGVACIVSSTAAVAQPASDVRVSDLVQAGKVRVAIGLGSPVLAMKDAKSGEVRGPAMDLARALAEKLGVKVEAIEYPRPGAILTDAPLNKWDVTFLVIDPARSGQADFSPPYMQSDFTYLVPESSPKRSVSEMDEAGVRIAVPRGDASDLSLTKSLKRAELVRVDSINAALEMVRDGKVDAYAAPRVVLFGLLGKAPGCRVLSDGFANISWAAMTPKGQSAHLAYIDSFLKEAKVSGFLQNIIDRYGLKGIRVAGQ